MDCCQLEQDCPPPAVKKEVLVDETDRKSPDQDPAGTIISFAPDIMYTFTCKYVRYGKMNDI